MINELAQNLEQELIAIRRELHKIPEIGTKEFKTSAFIKSKLDEYGIPYKASYNTGIIGYINPEKKNKTILLRADMDALLQTEQTGLEFASTHEGLMHACGHDFHVTCLLGAGKILNSLSEKIDGRIVLLFQPDEEFNGGALPMIEDGALDGVNAAIALHIEPLAKTGTIQIKDGPIMASPDYFDLEITGKSGHAATPEDCINPLSIVAEIIRKFEDIPKQIKPCVVSVCNIHAGTGSPNIIPDTLTLSGTVRTVTPDTRDDAEKAVRDIVERTCNSYGAEFKFDFTRLYPPLINNSKMNEIVVKACEKSGLRIEILDKCSMTGEDFAYFAERVPSSFFKLGTGDEKLGMYPLHNSKLNPDEGALKIGAKVLVQTAIDYIECDFI